MAALSRYYALNIYFRKLIQHEVNVAQTSFVVKRRCLSQVGFIGLGNMGAPMARNLLKKGHKLAVFDVNPTALAALAEAGATPCSSPGDVASQSDCVVTMLPSNAHVMDAYLGENGILGCVKSGTMLIDSSTVDPSVPKSLSSIVEEKGATLLDAPVSGGVTAATTGKLTFMVGGPTESFPAAQELLLGMGSCAIHCGTTGLGQAAKICNNMLLGVAMVGTAEAMNLGISLGLEPKLLMKVLNSSSGRCWSSEVYNPVPGTLENTPSSNNYQGGFATQLMAKDLGLAQAAASATNCPIPLGSLAHQIYRTMMVHGLAGKDFSVVYHFLKEASTETS